MSSLILPIGNPRQKANWFLVGFVFGCIFIIVGLLYVMQQAVAKAEQIDSISQNMDINY